MRKRITTLDLLAILAVAGISTNTLAQAANSDQSTKPGALQAVEKTSKTNLGSDSACGKGACGTDESGAKAAKEKKAAKAKPAPKADAKGKEGSCKAKADAKGKESHCKGKEAHCKAKEGAKPAGESK